MPAHAASLLVASLVVDRSAAAVAARAPRDAQAFAAVAAAFLLKASVTREL
jgi:hypothetical protein